MRTAIPLLFILTLPLTSPAATLTAEARAGSEVEARREALAALAETIYVDVRSVFSSSVSDSGGRDAGSYAEQRINVQSDLPLMGVGLTTVRTGRDYLCEARLDSARSLPLYTHKLDELLNQITDLAKQLADASDADRHALLLQAMTSVEQYDKHRAVADLLGERRPEAPLKPADLERQLHAIERAVPTLDLAAQLLTSDITAERSYIYPAVPHGSHAVTPLGRLLADRIAGKMKGVDTPDRAAHLFRGDYEIADNTIHVTYRLLDVDGNTLATRVVTLAPAAYAGIDYRPLSADFDQLLHEGLILGNDFRAELSTNRGRDTLLFEQNDEVELFAKLNRPGYFYAVGHVVKTQENFSYLLELTQGEGNRRFVRYVNADDVNKWISLGRFEVAAPFGVESLQLMASNDDPVDRLPSYRFLPSGFFVTADNAAKGVVQTRALKPKVTETDKRYQSEAVLMFTTTASVEERGSDVAAAK